MINRFIKLGVISLFVVVLAAAFAPGLALADEGAPEVSAVAESAASYPLAVRDRPDALYAQMWELAGDTLVINFSTGAVFKPFSLQPSFFYGLARNFNVGVRLAARRGGHGLCLAGSENGCSKAFNDFGVEGRYVVLPDGTVHITVHGGLDFEAFDPTLFLGLPIGATFHILLSPQLDILVDPTLIIGLTERDSNKEFLTLPVTIRFQANPNLNVFAVLGIAGPLDGFGDAYSGPAGVGATYAINNLMDVGAEFDFPNLYGKGSTADARVLVLRFALRR